MNKNLRLGIVGAENSHSLHISNLCNILEKVPVRVTHIWGETIDLAQKIASKTNIPHVVADWKVIADEVDGIMIDQRDGNQHCDVAEFFISKDIPTFVDKPMTCSLAESKKLLDLGQRRSVPVLTFSAKPIQKSFREFFKKTQEAGPIIAVNSSGPGEINSPWGGIFFYGIHQVDSIVALMGAGVKTARLERSGKNAVGTLTFTNGRLATMNFLDEGEAEFHWTAHFAKSCLALCDVPDEIPYLTSAKLISDLLHGKKLPFTRERMLAPIAILEALRKSLVSGEPETVDSFNRVSTQL